MYVHTVHFSLVLCFCGGLLTRSHRHCQLFLLVIRTIKNHCSFDGLVSLPPVPDFGPRVGTAWPFTWAINSPLHESLLFVGGSEFMISFISVTRVEEPRINFQAPYAVFLRPPFVSGKNKICYSRFASALTLFCASKFDP